MHSIASVRNHHLLDGLSGYFDETVAYTTANNRLFAGDSSLEVRVPVIRITTLDYRTIIYKLSKNKSQDIHLAEEKKQRWIHQTLMYRTRKGNRKAVVLG